MSDQNLTKLIAALSPEKRLKLAELLRPDPEPIAIIGIGCRLPGGADDPASFWRLLHDGVDAITEVPSDRWDIEAFYSPDAGAPGKMSTRWGGFLRSVDGFDAAFFAIAPREAVRLDPQERLLLEVVWEALEHADQPTERLAGTRTGVFVGVYNHDYAWLHLADPARVDAHSAAAATHCGAPNRVSHLLDLKGPSIAIDTACSSSLVAVHLACQSLRNQECHLALAGGVSLMLSPLVTVSFSATRMMAADGRCKTFDARADGYVRGEGCGVVVLKRLSDAVANGDRIVGLIRGTAVSQDGHTNVLSAPNGLAQQAVIREALANAGVTAAQVSYVEAHGTGTALGDPIELEALREMLGQPQTDAPPCAVGSLKTNIGHLEAAAGVAGLIKVLLALQHEAIPPHLHFRQLNPHISLAGTRFVIPTTLRPWPRGAQPRRAGVSSFGAGGTNAHVVVEEAPPSEDAATAPLGGPAEQVALLPLSARSAAALRALAGRYAEWLQKPAAPPLADIAYSASTRRTHHDHRLAIVASSAAALVEPLAAFASSEDSPCPSGSTAGICEPGALPKVVFVFPGQGSQWLGMGRELLAQEPVFRLALEQCDATIRRHAGWSLLEELAADPEHSRLAEVDVVQPCLFALEVALAALWQSWGIRPDAVVGHSLGEVAASCVAGMLSLDDAASVICTRSRLVKSTSGHGGMALAELPVAEAERMVAGSAVAVAAVNSPRTVLLSGEAGALRQIFDRLGQAGVFCRWVNVDYASHSAQMDPLRPALLQALHALTPRPGSIPMISTVSTQWHNGVECSAAYWARNLRETVQFWPAVERLLQGGHDVFLELSPHPVLTTAMQEGMRQRRASATVLASLQRQQPERAALLESVGALYTRGYPIDWRRLHPLGGRRVALPGYPWQHERYWIDPSESTSAPSTRAPARPATGHPLLGSRWQPAHQPDTHYWEVELSLAAFPYLGDHRVGDAVVFPAAAYVEMGLAAATALWGPGSHAVEQLTFARALALPEEGACTLQVVVGETGAGRATLQFSSRPSAAPETTWTLHATGALALGASATSGPPPAPARDSLAEIRQRCTRELPGAAHYEALEARALHCGPSFRTLERLWCGAGEALGLVGQTAVFAQNELGYHVHPTVLDATFQVLAAAVVGAAESAQGSDPFLPVGLEHFRCSAQPERGRWAHARLRALDADTVEADLVLLDEQGQMVLEARGLRAQRLATQRTPELSDWLYALEWQLGAATHPTEAFAAPGTWLLFSDGSGVGAALRAWLEERGERCLIVSPGPAYHRAANGHYQLNPAHPEDLQRLLQDAMAHDYPACRGVVHLWSLDATTAGPDALESATELGCVSVLHLVQSLARVSWPEEARLWLVTRGAHAVKPTDAIAVVQAPLWGLGKVIALEHPEWRCTRVDLSPDGDVAAAMHALQQELSGADDEVEIAWRDATRYVHRLVRSTIAPPSVARRVATGEHPYRLEIEAPGVLDHLLLRRCPRPAPGCGEVEIEVLAAGLNFKDVLLALGVIPVPPEEGPVPLGGECAGTVTAVGEGVQHIVVGQEVVAMAPRSFGRFVIAPAALVLPKPAPIALAQAAALPVAFMTAHYALNHLARLAAGERVLIHAATGGVGLAAVQLAQQVGAEIFATAGSTEKRDFLRALGVSHVFDSRSLTFADEVLLHTGGVGVDVVLNSLSGPAMAKSLTLLAPSGRFLEIGIRDIYANAQLGLRPFQKNLSYFAIDLSRLYRERPALLSTLLREVMARFADGVLTPPPQHVFPIAAAADAFRHMAQAKHIGKVVLSFREQPDEIAALSAAAPPLQADATYLITGGLGGLGLTVARWMVTRGARHLVLIGRHGATSHTAEAVAALQAQGAEVMVAAADVADEMQMRTLFTTIERTLPPLRGIIHAAGLLDDGILLNLNRERLQRVFAPKMQGAWNLHVLTRQQALDFFVLFSSGASLLGSPGQGNYTAANAFLDALAHHRHGLGLPALSINWGPWAAVGLAAAQSNRGERIGLHGIGSLTPEQGTAALEHVLGSALPQIGVIPLNLRQWSQSYPAAAQSPVCAHLVRDNQRRSTSAGTSAVRQELLALELGSQRRERLEAFVREQIAQVLRIDPARVRPGQSFGNLGFDSLMALELRNRLESSLEVILSSTLVWAYPNLGVLVEHLARRMGVVLEGDAQPLPGAAIAGRIATQEHRELDDLVDEIGSLSDDEVHRQLTQDP